MRILVDSETAGPHLRRECMREEKHVLRNINVVECKWSKENFSP